MNASGPVALQLVQVRKSFGPVVALRSGSLTVHSGSIHALVGENGAGKSTLVKIVAGVYQRDGGDLLLHGESVDFSSTAASKDAGIAVIYQEPTLFPDLSVTENIFMGRQPLGAGRRIDRKAMHDEALGLFQRLGVHLDPRRLAEGLSIADQQIIEIAKAISLDASVLIMDEPTAALSGVEVERLFAVARSLRDEGRALVFISHRFDEVFALCDTVTVMRDGEYISTDPIAETTSGQIVAKMVGREVGDLFPKTPAEIGEPVLTVSGLESPGIFHDVSFEVRAGEIVALAGLVGAGRSEIARAIFGVDGYDSGTVELNGKPVRPRNPRAAIRAGMGFVPEDRRQQGLVTDASVAHNVAAVIRSRIARWGLLTSGSETRTAGPWAGRLEVKTNALDMHATTMSGGNQQKVVIAKWLATQPSLLIIDEPTRGIDIGTKAEVHRLISELAGQGMAILMISSELPEVLGMADRVLVVHEGRITANLDRADATPESVMTAATNTMEVAGMTERQRGKGCHADAPLPFLFSRGFGMTDTLVAPSRRTTAQRVMSTIFTSRESAIALVLILVIAAATLNTTSFLFSEDGWRDLLLTPSILLLLATGQAVVIITRNVDLSVGSTLALTAYLTGRLFVDNPGIPIIVVVLIGMLAGAGLGLINGLLVALGRVPALVITLGRSTSTAASCSRGPARTASTPRTCRTASSRSAPRRSSRSRS